MLSKFRGRTAGIITPVLMGLLILSFAIWGVSGIFTGYNADTVAKVGPGEIDATEFSTAYQNQVRQFSQQFGQVITPELSRTLGLSDRVMGDLINQELINVQADQFGMGISNEKLGATIVAIPQFQGANGFDVNQFNYVVQQSGMSVPEFEDLVRTSEVTRQLQSGVSGGVKVPTVLYRSVQELTGEMRAISYVALTPEMAGEIPAPTDDELNAFMSETRGQWRTPEYRGITTLAARAADLADPAAITPDEVKAEYDRQPARFVVAEKRQVAQIVYTTEAAAAADLARITGGETFDAVFAAPGGNGSAIDLGLVARSGLLDPAVADAAFALENGAVSPVVDGRFGYLLVRVSQIVPEVVTPIETVEPTIRAEIAARLARDRALDLYETIEDARAAGQSFAEIGATFNLPVTVVPAVSRAGNGPDGVKIEGLPEQTALLAAAFESDVGLENDPLSTEDGGYLWYEVTSLTPARDQTLDEVREAVTTAWREDKVATALVDKATALAARIRAGETIAAIAGEIGVPVSTATQLNRYSDATGLSDAARDAAFGGPVGDVAIAPGATPGTQVVLVVDAATVPPPGTPEEDEVASHEQDIADDIMVQYLGYLRSQYGVTVNNALIQTIISSGAY